MCVRYCCGNDIPYKSQNFNISVKIDNTFWFLQQGWASELLGLSKCQLFSISTEINITNFCRVTTCSFMYKKSPRLDFLWNFCLTCNPQEWQQYLTYMNWLGFFQKLIWNLLHWICHNFFCSFFCSQYMMSKSPTARLPGIFNGMLLPICNQNCSKNATLSNMETTLLVKNFKCLEILLLVKTIDQKLVAMTFEK